MTDYLFDEDFFKGIPYRPEGFFLDRLVKVDPEEKLIVCEMDTRKEFPLIDQQRHHPILQPPHLPGAVIIHLTGMLGLAAARFLLDIRFDLGWSGYGSRIHKGEFKRLVTLGPPLLLKGRITRVRKRSRMVIVRYEFRFIQQERLAYAGDQTAVYQHYEIESQAGA